MSLSLLLIESSNATKMKSIVPIVLLLFSLNPAFSQSENIVKVMDDLRANWDTRAAFLQSYGDLSNLCRNRDFRGDLIKLLDNIHHYDTTLYNTVKVNYSNSEDPEVKATLEDIEKLERDYATLGFKQFIRDECGEYNMVENSFGKEGEEYEREKKRVEIELLKYVGSITRQIDLIDEHAHHLKLE